jgi:hypothetical protein
MNFLAGLAFSLIYYQQQYSPFYYAARLPEQREIDPMLLKFAGFRAYRRKNQSYGQRVIRSIHLKTLCACSLAGDISVSVCKLQIQ